MAPGEMTVNDALWRIVELASRSSDPKWRGDRTRVMHDLEAAIQEVAQAALAERDRERARAEHWEEQVAEALEALAAYQTETEAAVADRDDDLRALRRAHQELAVARAALAGVEAERDEARSALAAARTALATARTALATARVEAEEAEARRLAAERARRLAESERDAAVGVLERRPPVADVEIDLRTPAEATTSGDMVIGFHREEENAEPVVGATPRLLHVAATLGHLLPDDLDALLLPGTRVVRREGRLAALLAMTGGSPWAESIPDLEEKQAELLRSEGFRVEWSHGDRLAS